MHLLQQLKQRESHPYPSSYTPLAIRNYYSCIYPNKTLYNVNTPHCHIKRFSPDGRLLICFSKTLHEVQVYKYRPRIDLKQVGFESYFELHYTKKLVRGNQVLCKDFCLITNHQKVLNLMQMILASVAPSQSTTVNEPQSLDCIPQLDDIVFYSLDLESGLVIDEYFFESDYIFLNNHAGVDLYDQTLAITSIQHQSIHFLLIKQSGHFVFLFKFGKYVHVDDELFLSLHQKPDRVETPNTDSPDDCFVPNEPFESILGPSLLENTVQPATSSRNAARPIPVQPSAIRSRNRAQPNNNPGDFVQYSPSPSRQENIFHSPTRLGWNTTGQPRPNTVLSDGSTPLVSNFLQSNPFQSRQGLFQTNLTTTLDQPVAQPKPLSGFKQRIFSYLYRKAKQSNHPYAMTHFHTTFSHFDSLVMCKMHFIDAESILIKMCSADSFSVQETTSSSTSFFVFYSLKSNQVTAMYENTSFEMLHLYENYDLRGNSIGFNWLTCPSNNKYAQDTLMKQIYTIQKARNGGQGQALKRALASVPNHPQCTSDSPYFDHDLFSYDEKAIGAHEKPRTCSDMPCKFFCRKSKRMKFKLDANAAENNPHRNQK